MAPNVTLIATVVYMVHRGDVRLRGTLVRGTRSLVSLRENLGRELFTVKFDSGERLAVFAHEIELVSDDLAA